MGRLAQALHGRGELEDKLLLLAAIGGTLFVTLVATLFFVQHSLGAAQRRLVEQALPAEEQIARLENTIVDAFGRQSQVSSTVDLAQLISLRDRGVVEGPLRRAAEEIAIRVTDFPPEFSARARVLKLHVETFLSADAALMAAVERRHRLQASFEKELGAIDGDLRALVEDSQAVRGMLRLEYVLLLRGIAESMATGGARMDLVRTAVLGDIRGALDDTGELANAVLAFGWLGNKIGLAASSDAINSLTANELPQSQTRIARLIASLEGRIGTRAEAAGRTKKLSERFAGITPRITDEEKEGSLVALRRRVIAEAAAAAAIRAQAIAAAGELTADAAFMQAEVSAYAADSVRAQERVTTTTRLFSVLISLLGLIGCVIAGRRIRQAAEELKVKNTHLTELKDNLEHMNVNLESKVSERTAALVERDRSMQTVLDSMTEGLITVSLDGSLRLERSHAFTAWFGDPGNAPIWNVLFPDDADDAGLYQCGFEQIVADILPFEVAVDQMPKQIRRAGRTFDLELRSVEKAGRLDAVLFVITDVTEQIVALAAERAAREEQRVIANLLRDRRGFQRSVDDIETMIESCRSADPASLLRSLHTIKGNCAVLGFAATAGRAHALEEQIESDGKLSPNAIASLDATFHDGLRRIQEFIEQARGRIDIDSADFTTLIEQLKKREDYDVILAMVHHWQLEPIGTILQGLAGHARRLADQMGKHVEVAVEASGIRVGNDELRAFCATLVHAIRNAVDHGIETPEQRADAGKPETGRLKLSATIEGQSLVVSVADDGAGVDVERVRERARELGLPCETRSEVLEALFAAGLSTRVNVTELSGRGVGASAVQVACRALGGEAKIVSEWGRGTELRCVLPLSVIGIDEMRIAGAA